ncbi:uncharacterized protein PG986_001422 [Apiospora aurea]|uniref:Uncharacterized protein n=1 Tax=Apiospora aurea TaxID=335848 RepID=A0ABR1QWS7_9PEZI
MRALIVGQIVGGCGMYSGGLSYIAALTLLKERPIYTTGIAVLWGLGSEYARDSSASIALWVMPGACDSRRSMSTSPRGSSRDPYIHPLQSAGAPRHRI